MPSAPCAQHHADDLDDHDAGAVSQPSQAKRVKPCAQLLQIDVEHHDHEQEQHHHRADVHQHQHDGEKLRLDQQPDAPRG